MLITAANALSFTDYLGASYKKIRSVVDPIANQTSPTAGTLQKWMTSLQTLITTTVADYQQQVDMLADVHTSLLATNAEAVGKTCYSNACNTLNRHTQTQGSTVSASITNLASFLTFYNTTPFTNLVTPDFNQLWVALANNITLPPAGVMSPAIQPTFNTGASSHGMADRAIGSSITVGDSVNTSLYAAVVPLLEVTVVFSGGSAPPAYVITGTDHLGNAAASWTVTLTGNNPVAAVSTTITPAVTAQGRQTVAVASLTGIIAGSVLTVNAGLVDQEVIVVEAINGGGTTITAAFQLAHAGSAAITGFSTYALTPVNGARCVSVSAIAPTVTGTSAGKVRVIGQQDRVGV